MCQHVIMGVIIIYKYGEETGKKCDLSVRGTEVTAFDCYSSLVLVSPNPSDFSMELKQI